MRRTLIIIAVIIILIGVGVWAYFAYLSPTGQVAISSATSTPSAPFPQSGSNSTTPTQPESPQTVNETPSAQTVAPRLVEIDKGPVVAGAFALDASSTTNGVEVRYLERQSGNIFSYAVGSGSLTRISNKTIPGIEEADWLPSGASVFVRYLSGNDDSLINTYGLAVGGGTGFFLPQNIVSLSVSSTSLLALGSSAQGSVATLSRTDGSQARQAFTTPLSSLRTSFAGKQYLAFTKPSATLPGYAYLVNSTGLFDRIAGPLTGLVALASPKGDWVLISYTSGGILKLALVNLTIRETLPLPVGTIADKCAWSDDATIYCAVPVDPPTNYAYPDDWYQGAVSFNDRIWKINVTNRYAELVLDFSSAANAKLDATNLTTDPLQKSLVFRNKIDGSLWGYQL